MKETRTYRFKSRRHLDIKGTTGGGKVIVYSKPSGKTYQFEPDTFGKLLELDERFIDDMWLQVSLEFRIVLEGDSEPTKLCSSFIEPLDTFQHKCLHIWKKYVGIIEKYEYCQICDKKRYN